MISNRKRDYHSHGLNVSEFLCMDPSEDTMSPRRTIETSKSVTPGGTLVTETTTTTHKPQNQSFNSNVGDSPSYIEKRDYEYDPVEPQGGSSAFYRPASTVESTHTDEEMEARSATNTMSSPEITYSQPKDDIDLHKQQKTMETPNLKKSKSLGGSLKKLFRRSRKRSRSIGRGEQSRESSISRQSRHASQGPSREGSLTRSQHSAPQQHDTVIL